MKQQKNKIIKDVDLSKVGGALKRAAEKARKTAKDTHTPIIIYKDGRVTSQMVEEKR